MAIKTTGRFWLLLFAALFPLPIMGIGSVYMLLLDLWHETDTTKSVPPIAWFHIGYQLLVGLGVCGVLLYQVSHHSKELERSRPRILYVGWALQILGYCVFVCVALATGVGT